MTASVALESHPPAWAPLRHRLFRVLWLGQLASNIGTWMQVVGSQWLMGTLGGSSLQVSLVLTAMTLPVFAVALPAGALGDVLDRRQVLLWSQTVMLAGAAGLAVVALTGVASPWLLLALMFAIATGQGVALPSWQGVLPELVERPEIPAAAALNGVNANLARAIGPAIGGAVVALAGPGWAFALNAASFVAVLAVVQAWRRPPDVRTREPEQVRSAIRAGAGYLRHSPRLRAILARACLFVVPAGAVWAVLPVLARTELGLSSGGYGLLLSVVGVGAVAGAVAMARLRRRVSVDRLVLGGSIAFMAGCSVVALAPGALVLALPLAVMGGSWIAVLASLSGRAQTVLPGWVRSRGMSSFLLAVQGGQAVSAFAFGLVAQLAGSRVAFAAIAAGLAIGLPAVRRWPLSATEELDSCVHPMPAPEMVLEPEPHSGPVLVTVDYRVPAQLQDDFRRCMQAVGRMRRRTGARRWGLYQDGADPAHFVETFVVATWQEHLRQHDERPTAADRAVTRRALELVDAAGEPPRVQHLISAYAGAPRRRDASASGGDSRRAGLARLRGVGARATKRP